MSRVASDRLRKLAAAAWRPEVQSIAEELVELRLFKERIQRAAQEYADHPVIRMAFKEVGCSILSD